MLFVYAALFSYAYVSIDTATGALVLFGVVQITMFTINIIRGQKPSRFEYVGVILSLCGFTYLILPHAQTPSAIGFAMMSLSGVAWAVYTLLGQRSTNAIGDTAFNFIRTFPMVCMMFAVACIFFQDSLVFSSRGVLLAVASGALTSGAGYALWYAVLPSLKTLQAAVIQLMVPVIAAVGGILFAGEILTWPLVIASAMILGGILCVVLGKQIATSIRKE